MTKVIGKAKHGRKQYEYDWFYHSKAWEKIRRMALDRDNYLCQRCLSNNKITSAKIVHHITYLDDDFSKALDLDNLMCVCQDCHNKIHANDTDKTSMRNVRVMKI
ncbi:HNH endonuclease [Staphylococcus haemolyticus]|uniref:HNH endonuclease n=1 Tax=Staphylococcus haemolyticus TaxID=1283 RepID=UPI00051D7382|nr:HNH endonuclease signature motif containing protein [Staphylococcus haemolyticus]KGJ25373.1 HNH endonuclease [Staphylococcus haemolyticus]KGJ29241.1 HNH endonuclease [Staphylococcus haemolyticus]MCH4326213.1 HNH endonuclease [Staphylococcus haemolyticus]MCH4414262.1 HNH endonuclease [Staphylococcus haemolyticus]MCH4419071.1 HNH endonuclease [Staphylococcus haemolyticus]